jgi:hypothetical protein
MGMEIAANWLLHQLRCIDREMSRSVYEKPKYHEKILHLSPIPGTQTGPLSLTCQAARVGINPRFFLTNPFLQ